MDSIILSSAYLGPVEYYSKLYHYKKILIEAKENYIKQTYRNRCFIGAANDIQSLSIPVESSGGMKRGIKDIRVSDHANWRHQHWYAIKSTYNSTPFFEFYEDDFAPFFEKKYDFLFDLNEELRILICELLGMETEVGYTEEFILPEKISEISSAEKNLIEVNGHEFLDFRYDIHPKKNYKLLDPEYKDVDYYQLFSQKWGFRPNLSIIDLLFNMGPESILVLRDSRK